MNPYHIKMNQTFRWCTAAFISEWRSRWLCSCQNVWNPGLLCTKWSWYIVYMLSHHCSGRKGTPTWVTSLHCWTLAGWGCTVYPPAKCGWCRTSHLWLPQLEGNSHAPVSVCTRQIDRQLNWVLAMSMPKLEKQHLQRCCVVQWELQANKEQIECKWYYNGSAWLATA